VSVAAAFVYRYGKEPCLELTIAAELLEAEKRRQKDVLRYIFDVTGPAQQPVRQRGNVGRVLLDNPVKSSFIAPAELFDQQVIITYLGHGCHIRPMT
jgi:hypothetical protein